jgi:hypothetical protein
MSNITKSDLIKQNKALKNQVSQLQRSKSVRKVSANSNQKKNAQVPAATVPSWSGQSKSLRIHQMERIANVTSNSTTAGNFKADSYIINPANPTTFPWLSGIANLFDKYKFHKLRFFFINNSPTSIAGNVTMAVDFDTLDAVPSNGIGMSNLAKFVSFAPWKSEELSIPVQRPGNNSWLFTTNEVPMGTDAKTYNLGNFLISTEGISSTDYLVGYLCVEYDVELLDKNPNSNAVIPDPDLSMKYVLVTYANQNVDSGLSAVWNNSSRLLTVSGLTPDTTLQLTAYINNSSSTSGTGGPPGYTSCEGATLIEEKHNTYDGEGVLFFTGTFTANADTATFQFSSVDLPDRYGFSACQPTISS